MKLSKIYSDNRGLAIYQRGNGSDIPDFVHTGVRDRHCAHHRGRPVDMGQYTSARVRKSKNVVILIFHNRNVTFPNHACMKS